MLRGEFAELDSAVRTRDRVRLPLRAQYPIRDDVLLPRFTNAIITIATVILSSLFARKSIVNGNLATRVDS